MALALNNKGQIVVASVGHTTPHVIFDDYLWQKGKAVLIRGLHSGFPTGFGLTCCGINEQGVIVGQAESAVPLPKDDPRSSFMHPWHAFLWRRGKMTDLGALPHPSDDSSACAINDKDQVAGDCGNGHSFLWQNGKMQDIGVLPGYYDLNVFSLNNKGQVVGNCIGSESRTFSATAYEEPFLWENGILRDLGTLPGCTKTFVRGLNDVGDVIGFISPSLNVTSAPDIPILWHDGKIYDLNDLISIQDGFRLAEPFAINNRGQIVCIGYTNAEEQISLIHNDIPHVFMLTPIAH